MVKDVWMMIPRNKRRSSLLAALALLLLIVTLAVFQFSASTKTYARGNASASVQVQRHGSPLWPQIRSTPESAGAGSYFYLSGTGFHANEQMTVYWQTAQ